MPTCPYCQGRGELHKSNPLCGSMLDKHRGVCKACHGTGEFEENNTMQPKAEVEKMPAPPPGRGLLDLLGNEIKTGDFIQIKLESPYIYGRILEVHEPSGLSVPGQDPNAPKIGLALAGLTIPIKYIPGRRIGDIVAVVESADSKAKALAKPAGSS